MIKNRVSLKIFRGDEGKMTKYGTLTKGLRTKRQYGQKTRTEKKERKKGGLGIPYKEILSRRFRGP